jgi:hypothetical protein
LFGCGLDAMSGRRRIRFFVCTTHQRQRILHPATYDMYFTRILHRSHIILINYSQLKFRLNVFLIALPSACYCIVPRHQNAWCSGPRQGLLGRDVQLPGPWRSTMTFCTGAAADGGALKVCVCVCVRVPQHAKSIMPCHNTQHRPFRDGPSFILSDAQVQV